MAGHVAHEVGEHQADAVPDTHERGHGSRPETDEKELAHAGAVAVGQHRRQVEHALVASGDGDVRRVEQLGAHDQGRDHEQPRDDVRHGVVDAHDSHVRRGVPALLPQPVPVRRQGDRATDPAGEREDVDEATVRDARHQPVEQFRQVRQRDHGGADHGDEHQPDECGEHLLEQAVAAAPHQCQADETRDDAPPGDRDSLEERVEGEAGAGHGGGAVHEAPDDDVGREVPRGPDAEGAPALEDGASGGQAVAAGALNEDDLHQASDHGAPQQQVAVLAAGDQRGHQVGGPDAGGGDHQPWSDQPPPRHGGLFGLSLLRHAPHP